MMLSTVTLCTLVTLAGSATETHRLERVELPHGYYWLAEPVEAHPGTRYPLVVCLHGTETKAADMVSFWLSLEAGLPFIFVAPQGVAPGWRDADLRFMQEVRSHLEQTVSYDPQRFMLTGHSAGGAMTFHLLYAEGFPASAAAVTANYLPPTVTAEMVRARREVPLFYAVGEADLNRPRMRQGLYLLRGAGASVTVQRPPIGHVLSRQIGQAALKWFESVCREVTEARLARARRCLELGSRPGEAAAGLEAVIRQRQAQFRDQLTVAADLLTELQRAGHQRIAEAELRAGQGELMLAREELVEIERLYEPSSTAEAARKRRLALEAHPSVAKVLNMRNQQAAREKAETLWRSVLTALAETDIETARQRCRSLVTLYPDSPHAATARQVLSQTDNVSVP